MVALFGGSMYPVETEVTALLGQSPISALLIYICSPFGSAPPVTSRPLTIPDEVGGEKRRGGSRSDAHGFSIKYEIAEELM